MGCGGGVLTSGDIFTVLTTSLSLNELKLPSTLPAISWRDHNISIMFVLARRMPGGARLWTIFSPLYPSVKGNMLPEMAHTATAAAATSV